MKKPLIIAFQMPTAFLKMRHNRGYTPSLQQQEQPAAPVGVVLAFSREGGLTMTGEKIDPTKLN